MDHYNWTAVPAEKMNALLTRQAIHTDTMTVARLHMAKGAVVPMHQHENEQFSTIESGALRFEVGGTEIVVRAGEMLRIPAHVPHMAEAIEDCVATDVFTPPRLDWIRGEDAYLRR